MRRRRSGGMKLVLQNIYATPTLHPSTLPSPLNSGGGQVSGLDCRTRQQKEEANMGEMVGRAQEAAQGRRIEVLQAQPESGEEPFLVSARAEKDT